MKKNQNILRKYPLLTALIALTVAFVIILMIPTDETITKNLQQEIPLALLTVLLLIGIGGISLIKFKTKGIGFTFKKSILYLLPGVLISISSITGAMSSHSSIQPNWLALVSQAIIFYFLLGIFEEGLFRGIIMHAFLAKMGKTRGGLIWAVAINGLIFGFVHILLDWFLSGVDLSTLGLLQAILKTLSTGMAGFFFGAVYLKTRNIWGISLVHGLSNLLLMVGSLLFTGSNAISYVSSDPKQAMSTILIYFLFILLYIPLVISGWKQLKAISLPELGFYKKEWS
ncbi:CPBP family intramembrane glutamic endopeptidase [Enterococcus innesii]|uniref:CPBP family intramembrane glutamic endopeptidase n=1 Tax=Enterococcus innesii TaxID=2839759 RepID=UPI00232DCDC5|nr:CPBP family intramembrane glutamic endopeptidase [Enterococcus innesii]MDC0753137.1 CPBP family intramembrane metalloprotease [Enterococcus innesii]MDC0777226.1 CPBP family intramembrane metalloprotease [Enterococcus innesii]MDC0780844.1 CPBP family intramembrane metalloprotease [Enterococcus innesii]MDC0783972.1 CPBP family intramembrane metalloprotease [Enterococcus innesii]